MSSAKSQSAPPSPILNHEACSSGLCRVVDVCAMAAVADDVSLSTSMSSSSLSSISTTQGSPVLASIVTAPTRSQSAEKFARSPPPIRRKPSFVEQCDEFTSPMKRSDNVRDIPYSSFDKKLCLYRSSSVPASHKSLNFDCEKPNSASRTNVLAGVTFVPPFNLNGVKLFPGEEEDDELNTSKSSFCDFALNSLGEQRPKRCSSAAESSGEGHPPRKRARRFSTSSTHSSPGARPSHPRDDDDVLNLSTGTVQLETDMSHLVMSAAEAAASSSSASMLSASMMMPPPFAIGMGGHHTLFNHQHHHDGMFAHPSTIVSRTPNSTANFRHQLNANEPPFHGVFATPTREESVAMELEGINTNSSLEVVRLCKLKVRIVILDLDQTLLDTHTGGRSQLSGEILARHIRPVFRVLIPKLLEQNIPIGIATFSPQEDLVKEMLLSAFPQVEFEKNVFVRGRRAEDMGQGSNHDSAAFDVIPMNEVSDADHGKRKHIQCILDRVPAGKHFAPGHILFVDDDENNVTSARIDGHRVVQYRVSWGPDLLLNSCLKALRN